MGYLDPGQQFIVRCKYPGSAGDMTAVVSLKDLTHVSGALLTLTTATSTTVVVDTKLAATITYLGRTVEFVSNANATSLPNVGVRRVITGYVESTKTMTFSVALPATPQVGDGYKILSPVPRSCTKVALIMANQKLIGASTNTGFTFQLTHADGTTWGLSHPNNNIPPPIGTPIEFDLSAHGDLTCLFDSTTAGTTEDHYLVFTSS
jgi:hypothetical protein